MQRPEKAFLSYNQTGKDPYFTGELGNALKSYCLDYSQFEATSSQQSFSASPGKGTSMANSSKYFWNKEIFRRLQPNRSRVQQCTGLNFD